MKDVSDGSEDEEQEDSEICLSPLAPLSKSPNARFTLGKNRGLETPLGKPRAGMLQKEGDKVASHQPGSQLQGGGKHQSSTVTLLSTTGSGCSMGPGTAEGDKDDPDTRESNLLRAQAKLVDLLDCWEHQSKQTPRCELSSDSRKLFRRFIRGYVSSGPAHKYGNEDQYQHVREIAGDWKSSLELDRPRTEGDHYDFFARIPYEHMANPQDNDRRLQHLRIHQIRSRVAHQPVQDYFSHEFDAGVRRGAVAREAPEVIMKRDSGEMLSQKPGTAPPLSMTGSTPASTRASTAASAPQSARSSAANASPRSRRSAEEEGLEAHPIKERTARLLMARRTCNRGVHGQEDEPELALKVAGIATDAPGLMEPRGRRNFGAHHTLPHTHQSAALEENKRTKRGTLASQDMRLLRSVTRNRELADFDGSDSSDEDSPKDAATSPSRKATLAVDASATLWPAKASSSIIPGQRTVCLPRASNLGDADGLKRSRSGEKGRRKNQEATLGAGRASATSAAATAALKAEMRTREACESLRFLVFGCDVPHGKHKDGVAIFEQKCGTRDEVMQLHGIWNQMDEDGSGDVEFQEFLSFFSKSKADRLLGMRCVKYLVGSQSYDNDEKPDGCRIEDMMRLIWLKSTPEDIDRMMNWFREAEFQNDRVSTPPLLPRRKRREVIENFPSIEIGETIIFQDLVDSGLIDESMAKDLREQYDRDGTGRITEDLLLEMLCPNGYRSHPDAQTAIDKYGQPLLYVSNGIFKGWIGASKAHKWEEYVGEMERIKSEQLEISTPQHQVSTPRRNSFEHKVVVAHS